MVVLPCCNVLHMYALPACICMALHLHDSESKLLWEWSHSDSTISVRVWLTPQNQKNSKNPCPLAFREPLRQPPLGSDHRFWVTCMNVCAGKDHMVVGVGVCAARGTGGNNPAAAAR